MANQYEPKGKEKQTREMIQKVWARAKDFKRPLNEKYFRIYQQYRAYARRKPYQYSNLFIPDTFAAVETLMPRMLARRPKFFLKTYSRKAEEAREKWEKKLNHDMDCMNLELLNVDWVKQFLLYGNSPLKVWWKREVRTKPKEKGFLNLFKRFTEWLFGGKKEVVMYDGPDAEVADIYSFFWDPDGEDVGDAKYGIFLNIRTPDEVKNRQDPFTGKPYNNTEFVKGSRFVRDYKMARAYLENRTEAGRLGESEIDIESLARADGTLRQDMFPQRSIYQEEKVEIIECWFHPSKEYPLGRVVTAADPEGDCIILRNEHSPFWHAKIPCVVPKNHPLPKEFSAIGDVEMLEGLQAEKNEVRNQRQDARSHTHAWRIRPGADVDENELVTQENQIIHAESGDVEIIKYPDVNPSLYTEEEVIGRDMQNVSGATSYVRGQREPGQTQTATGIVNMQLRAGERFGLKVRLFEIMGWEALGQMVLELNAQYLLAGDKEKELKIEDEFVEFTKEDLAAIKDCEVKVEIGSVLPIDDLTRRQDLINLFNLIAKIEDISPEFKKNIIRRIAESFNIKDTEDMFLEATPAASGQETMSATGGVKDIFKTIPLIPKEATSGREAGPRMSVPKAPESRIPASIPRVPKE